MQSSGSGTWAGRWSILVGACLALVAAGSFVAFSLVARDAGLSGLSGRIEARRLATTSPVVTLGEPPNNDSEGSGPGSSSAGGSVAGPETAVLGIRFFNGPAPVITPKTPDRPNKPARNKSNGGHEPASARRGGSGKPAKPHKSGGPKGKSRGHGPHGHGPQGNGSHPGSHGNAPQPQGQANGHEKARGKGHDKHPGDH